MPMERHGAKLAWTDIFDASTADQPECYAQREHPRPYFVDEDLVDRDPEGEQ